MQEIPWWKSATAYQIYPSSFCDSNNDGCGDIPGIISKLDYLRDLGITLIWLSPVYDSPQHDMGYDVRNYEDIWSRYGTLLDMEELIHAVKQRGMRIIMDLVVNHTSHEHEWFLASRESQDNPHSDWYHWRDPKGWDETGQPIRPNNWRGAFGGSVWTYASERKQFYLHLALSEQPDLNWFNEETRRAVYRSAIESWLKKGIDGFRVDVVNFYWKELTFPDARIVLPDEEFQPMEPQFVLNGPRMHEWLQEQRKEVLDKYGKDVFLVGELPGTGKEESLRYLDPKHRELDTVFDMDIFMAGNTFDTALHDMKRPKLTEIKQAIAKTQAYIDQGVGWPTVFLESHDYSRSVSRFGPGPGQHQVAAARMLAMLVCTLSGTLFMYQGQEIGMTGVPRDWRTENFRDRAILKYLEQMDEQYSNNEAMKKRAFAAAVAYSRDNARTPMQWSTELNAGFSNVRPWIRLNESYLEGVNVASQLGDDHGVLEFWRNMLKLRQQHGGTFIHGHFRLLDEENEEVLSYVKSSHDVSMPRVVVHLNFTSKEQQVKFDGSEKARLQLLVSSASEHYQSVNDVLGPWEGRTYIVHDHYE